MKQQIKKQYARVVSGFGGRDMTESQSRQHNMRPVSGYSYSEDRTHVFNPIVYGAQRNGGVIEDVFVHPNGENQITYSLVQDQDGSSAHPVSFISDTARHRTDIMTAQQSKYNAQRGPIT